MSCKCFVPSLANGRNGRVRNGRRHQQQPHHYCCTNSRIPPPPPPPPLHLSSTGEDNEALDVGSQVRYSLKLTFSLTTLAMRLILNGTFCSRYLWQRWWTKTFDDDLVMKKTFHFFRSIVSHSSHSYHLGPFKINRIARVVSEGECQIWESIEPACVAVSTQTSCARDQGSDPQIRSGPIRSGGAISRASVFWDSRSQARKWSHVAQVDKGPCPVDISN
jgi:hypothetical protein